MDGEEPQRWRKHEGKGFSLWKEDYPLGGPLGPGTEEILASLSRLSSDSVWCASRLPGDPWGLLRQVQGTPTAVPETKPLGQHTH